MNVDYDSVAARAEPLQERVRHGHTREVDDPSELSEEAVELLESFTQVATDGTWDGEAIDEPTLVQHVAFEQWPDDEPHPPWVGEFRQLLTAVVGEEDVTPSGDVGHLDETVPFVHLLWPLVTHAWADLTTAYPTDYLTAAGRRDCQTMLLDRLVDVLAQPLHVDFVRYVAESDPTVVREGRRSPHSTEWYDSYIRAFSDGRAGQFFETYPVAARLLADTVRQWRDSIGQFCARAAADQSTLTAVFGELDGPSRVDSVESVGDHHEENDCVLLVGFETDTTLLYKPRSVEPERALYEVQSWMSETFDGVPRLETPTVASQDGYGWVECVHRETHADIESVATYYERAGALLAVAHALLLTDCHYENVIATAESPVVTDAETVSQSTLRPAEGEQGGLAGSARIRVIEPSVLGTGLLPQDTVPDDASGLGGLRVREPDVEQLSWTDPNTDAMDIEYTAVKGDPQLNFPVYDGDPAPPAQFLDEITSGFERTYDAVSANRERFLDKLDAQFEAAETRVVLRSTVGYRAVLDAIRSPASLRHGARYDLEIRRALSVRSPDPTLQITTEYHRLDDDLWDRIIDAEHEALRRGDVPRFTMTFDGVGLNFDGEEIVEQFTERSGFRRVASHTETFCPEHRQRQVGLVRATLTDPVPLALLHHDGGV